NSTLRFCKGERIPHVADAEFIYRISAEILGIAQIHHLGASGSVGIVGETGSRNGGSAVRIGRVQQVIIGKVIEKQGPETSVLVNPDSPFVVAQCLRVL